MHCLSVVLLCLLPVFAAAQTLNLLVEDDWYPYAAMRYGKAEGMAVDIVQEAYRAVGVSVSFQSMPYARCMRLTEIGRYAGCFNSLKDATTEPVFLFGQQPLFTATIGIYAYADNPQAMAVRSLAGKRVGLTNGYTYGSEVEQDRKMIKEYAGSDLANLRKLGRKRLDYALVYTRVADYLVAHYPQDLERRVVRVGTVIETPLYLSFSRVSPRAEAAMRQLDRGMMVLQQNGKYQQILKRWQDYSNGKISKQTGR